MGTDGRGSMDAGITTRAVRDLFQAKNSLPKGSSATVTMSYVEIYNEKVRRSGNNLFLNLP